MDRVVFVASIDTILSQGCDTYLDQVVEVENSEHVGVWFFRWGFRKILWTSIGEREVEFTIELIRRTTPVSLETYWMN